MVFRSLETFCGAEFLGNNSQRRVRRGNCAGEFELRFFVGEAQRDCDDVFFSGYPHLEISAEKRLDEFVEAAWDVQ
jgi:hypothetical protein